MVSKQRVLFQFLFLIFLCVAFTFKISHYLPQYADDGHDKFSLVVTGTGTGTYKYDPKPHEDPHSLDEFQFQFDNAVANFTLPEWMEEFFNSQPIATHNKTLADPKEKFIVLSCHKVSQKSVLCYAMYHVSYVYLVTVYSFHHYT